MSDTYRNAYIYVCNVFAGVLSENDYGYSFSYDEEYLKNDKALAVSLTLPISKKEYQSKTLFPFFDGLIPEGWLFDVVTHNWKISPNDRFGVLLVACRDAIGNVSVRSERL